MIIQVSSAARGYVKLRFPYEPRLVSLVKQFPGRRYIPDERAWLLPAYNLREMQSLAARSGHDVSVDPEIAAQIDKGLAARDQLLQLREAADASLPHLGSPTTLYPFQRADVKYLLTALETFHGALLANDMGTGKSVTALATIVASQAYPALILCPATLKYNWQAEIAKHFPQLLPLTQIVNGPAPERRHQWANPKAKIWVANYELLLRDKAPLLKKWAIVVADEARRVKTYNTQTARVVKRLDAAKALALSGVPIENRLEELHSIMDFCMPGLLGPGWVFVAQHCVKNPWGAIVGYKGVEKVKERIKPHYLRRTKAQVLPWLPAKIQNDHWLELNRQEWQVYEAIRRQIREYILASPKLRASNVLTQMLRLKQTTSDLRLLDVEGQGTKLEALADILEASEGHQVVAFSQFAQLVKRLGKEFGAFTITGDMNAMERIEVIQRFEKGEPQLLVSTDAGAFGVNLVAADIVVIIDQPWNPAILRQREDRLHRIGQKRSVQVIHLLARRTVDEYVRQIIFKKLSLISSVFDEEYEEIANTAITREDLLALLGEN